MSGRAVFDVSAGRSAISPARIMEIGVRADRCPSRPKRSKRVSPCFSNISCRRSSACCISDEPLESAPSEPSLEDEIRSLERRPGGHGKMPNRIASSPAAATSPTFVATRRS